MTTAKQKVNAKKFILDLRAGMSDEELMSAYSLDPKTFEKLLRLLVDKELLDPGEIMRAPRLSPASEAIRDSDTRRDPSRHETDPDDYEQSSLGGFRPRDGTSQCPQCGAPVTKKMLTCPECGHVLPGEERWTNVEPEKGFFERIPAKLLGYLLAVPVVLFCWVIFKYVLVPMSAKTAEHQTERTHKFVSPAKVPFQRATSMARKAAEDVLQEEIERLQADDIIASADNNFRVLTAGPRWNELSYDDKMSRLQGIRTAMERGMIRPDFHVVDSTGASLAIVKDQSIQVLDWADKKPN